MSDDVFDPILRKKLILADLGVDNSTLSAWIKRGDFPPPLILNPNTGREIIGWRTSTYRQWKNDRPQRPAKPITDAAYTETARIKRQQTRAVKRAAKRGDDSDSVPSPARLTPPEPAVAATDERQSSVSPSPSKLVRSPRT